MKRLLFALFLFSAISNVAANLGNYSFKVFEGNDQFQEPVYSFALPRFMQLMNSYPYLYDINYDETREIYDLWALRKDSTIIMAYCDGEPAGYIRGMGFDIILSVMVQACKDAGLDVQTYYYISDEFIDPAHRNKGLSKQLFKELEAYAVSQGYLHGVLDSEAHENHPLKPKNFKEIDYSKLGYTLSSEVVCILSGDVQAENGNTFTVDHPHQIDFWFKDLSN